MANGNQNSRDGMRRYEDLLAEAIQKADQALAIATLGDITKTDAVLPISNGGTGSSTKNFVDLETNQFNILGSKIFKSTCGFQKESDIVNSGEIAGNIRLITCDEQGADIGPQMRYSGRNTDGDATPYAFATTAGRKENGISGNKAGYFQIATTTADCVIIEALRANSEQNIGIGAIPVLGSGTRLHVSGGDILLDSEGGQRTFRLQISDVYGRLQAVKNIDGIDSESIVLSVNTLFGPSTCELDGSTGAYGTAAIDVRANGASATEPGGLIRFLVGGPDECPSLRGFFHEDGLDVIGNAFVSENIVAGGINNVVSGPGNPDAVNGFITGENIKFGSGAPEGVVYARIGALYGRTPAGGSDAPGENNTIWAKIFDDGGPTGWLPISTGGLPSVCVQSDCPEFSENSDGEMVPDCQTWFDRSRNLWFYWDQTVVRTVNGDTGAWLSADLFQVALPVTGRSHSTQFRGQIDKDYEYLTPMRVVREQLNMFLVDITSALRVSNNAQDRLANYYTFDLVTLRKRQGDPVRNASTRQEWPGDREAFETRRDNLRGDGHTLHENLRDDLIALSSLTPNGADPIEGVGTVTEKRRNRRVLIDSSKATIWAAGQWAERNNDDRRNGFPANNGFRVQMTSGNYAGIERTIYNNTETTLVLRRPWPRLRLSDNSIVTTPDAGDTYEILDSQHKKIIARVSTKGNVWRDGAHVDPNGDRTADPPPLFAEYSLDEEGNTLTRSQVVVSGVYKTRDVQDFVRSVQNGLDANNPGGDDDVNTHYIRLDHYIDIFGSEVDATEPSEPTDAVVLAGLWDAVRSPGAIAGVISVTYRLALPPLTCQEGTVA